MKKITNMIEFNTKGELYEFDENKIIKTQIVGKNDTKYDEVDLREMIESITQFCKENMDKDIELKMSLKVCEE